MPIAYTAAMFPVNGAGGPGTASFFGTPAQTAAFFNSGLLAKKGHVSEDFWAVSGKLLFKPSDTFKITFAGDYSKKDDDTGNSGYNTTPSYPVNFVLPGFLGFSGRHAQCRGAEHLDRPDHREVHDGAARQRALPS